MADVSRLGKAALCEQVCSERAGYVAALDVKRIGQAAVALGAGRLRKGDPIDHQAGIVVHKKLGDQVADEDVLADVYTNRPREALAVAACDVQAAYIIGDAPVERPEVVDEILV